MAAELAEADREVLAGALAAVFSLVAGADGKIDRTERKRFEAMLGADHNASSEVMGEILALAGQRAEAIFADAGGDPEPLLERAGRTAEQSLSDSDCAAYKQGLWMMGEAIARSSGGGLLGIGDRVDPSEHVALRRLRELLRI